MHHLPPSDYQLFLIANLFICFFFSLRISGIGNQNHHLIQFPFPSQSNITKHPSLIHHYFLQATQSPLLFRSLSFPIPSPSTSTQSTSLHLREAHDATTLPIRGVRCHHTPLSSASHSLLNFSVCFPLHLLLFFFVHFCCFPSQSIRERNSKKN